MDPQVDLEEKKEEERTPLPEGYKLRKKEVGSVPELPPGYKFKPRPKTPEERDEIKLMKEAGILAAPKVTPEDLKKMSVQERLQFIEDLKREREFLQAGQFTKGALSGLTFGATENIEALKPIEFEEFNPYSASNSLGQVVGSFIPLSKLIQVIHGPVAKLVSKSPVFQKQISSLLTMFGVGATSGALESIAKGEMPDAQEVLENGFNWALLDVILQTAGVGGRFAKSLLTRSKATGTSRKEILNNVINQIGEGLDVSKPELVAARALEMVESALSKEELERASRIQLPQAEKTAAQEVAESAMKEEIVTPQDLKTKKITDEKVNRLNKEEHIIAEPYQPKLNLNEELGSLEGKALQEEIDSVGTRAASEEELGSSIREDIETELERRKKEYRPLYDEAEAAAETMLHTPANTARVAGNKLRNISRIKTQPERYGTAIRHLENALTDAGFTVERDKAGNIVNILKERDVPVENTIELARRLNEIVDYEAIEPTVVETLRGVARAAKADVRAALENNADALAAFELAEAEHAKVASRYSKDSIRKIRGQEAGEKISKMAESPSVYSDLKETLSPQQMLQVEREFLEKLNKKNYEQGKKTLREMERHLSEENKKLAREIVEAKNPSNTKVKSNLQSRGVLDEVSDAFSTGKRPKKTLDLWKTRQGQKIVKEAFRGSPNWPDVKRYLESQSFNDFIESTIKDGKFDLKKYNEIRRNPTFFENIRELGGKEAEIFFRDLDKQVRQFRTNLSLLERLPPVEDIKRVASYIKSPQAARTSRGFELMQKGVEKAARMETQIEKLAKEAEVAKKGKEPKKVPVSERGEQLLKEMTNKDYPFKARINAWNEWLKETLGLNTKTAISVFGVAKIAGGGLSYLAAGLPGPIISLVAYRMFSKMITSNTLRKAFLDASKKGLATDKFIQSLFILDKEMEKD